MYILLWQAETSKEFRELSQDSCVILNNDGPLALLRVTYYRDYCVDLKFKSIDTQGVYLLILLILTLIKKIMH